MKFIDNYSDRVNKFKKQNPKYLPQVLTIPFEPFVLNPDQYIFEINTVQDAAKKAGLTPKLKFQSIFPRGDTPTISINLYVSS